MYLLDIVCAIQTENAQYGNDALTYLVIEILQQLLHSDDWSNLHNDFFDYGATRAEWKETEMALSVCPLLQGISVKLSYTLYDEEDVPNVAWHATIVDPIPSTKSAMKK
jgi:hypothetical protein